MDIGTIAVLGGGSGAHAMAADLTLAGFKVNMFELPLFRESFMPTLKGKVIEIEGAARRGRARLNKVTVKIDQALSDVDLIFVVVPAYAQKEMAEICAPHLKDHHIIILTPGYAGSLEFYRTVKEVGLNSEINYTETSILPYICRMTGPARVTVYITAKLIPLGVFPSKHTPKISDRLKHVYKTIIPAGNVLEAALNNPGPIVHPSTTLLNVGRMEYSKGKFNLFSEGVTPAVINLYDVIDVERYAVCDSLNMKRFKCEDEASKEDQKIRLGLLYGRGVLKKAAYKLVGPTDTSHNYVVEDVPYGLVLISSLSDMLKVPTPIIKSIVNLFSMINQVDYWKEGRTVEKLGISFPDIDRLEKYLFEGS